MTSDPQQARLIKDDLALREAIGTVTDFIHATPDQLVEAADTIERLTRNADLLTKAKWAREIAAVEQNTKGTAAADGASEAGPTRPRNAGTLA